MTPNQGCAHWRSSFSVAPGATVTPNVLSTPAPGSKSRHLVAYAGSPAGHEPEFLNAGVSHDAMLLPLASIRLLLAAEEK